MWKSLVDGWWSRVAFCAVIGEIVRLSRNCAKADLLLEAVQN
jgi:hypothetical protein